MTSPAKHRYSYTILLANGVRHECTANNYTKALGIALHLAAEHDTRVVSIR